MRTLLSCLLLLCVTAQAQDSQTIYRTVDDSGAVSFSDTPPEGDQAVEEVTIDVAPPQDPDVYRQNLEDMRETTDRMAEDRRAREKHRAEMRELAARSAPPAQPPQDLVDHYSTTWYRSYNYGHHYRPGRPPWRPHPEPPIYRPPVQPQPGIPARNNSQLMRPMLPRGN